MPEILQSTDAKRLRLSESEYDAPEFQFDFSNHGSIKADYEASHPFKHAIVDNLFDSKLLANAYEEIKKLHFTFKETDIYKINQTGDLANLDGLPKEEKLALQNLNLIKTALYSTLFKSFIQRVTGCGEISGVQDMSINEYTPGCHLLTHDDVIGSRLISYILYLPDEENTSQGSGGRLELYPVISAGNPDVCPSKFIDPRWNRIVFFEVKPGYSFHAVEEVMRGSRISISGWFHCSNPSIDHVECPSIDSLNDIATSDNSKPQSSTLQNILLGEDVVFTEYEAEKEIAKAESIEMSLSEVKYLSEFINPQYLNLSILKQIDENFKTNSFIKLAKFLKQEVVQEIKDLIKLVDADTPEGITLHSTETSDCWAVKGPPHLRRYMYAINPSIQPPNPTPSQALSSLLLSISTHLTSYTFRKWLSIVTSSEIISQSTSVRRFRRGLDYTLATSHPYQTISSTLSLTLPDKSWDDGLAGGYVSILEASDGDAAVYKDGEDEVLCFEAGWNCLDVVFKGEGVLEFVKYVSGSAVGSRWDIYSELKIE